MMWILVVSVCDMEEARTCAKGVLEESKGFIAGICTACMMVWLDTV